VCACGECVCECVCTRVRECVCVRERLRERRVRIKQKHFEPLSIEIHEIHVPVNIQFIVHLGENRQGDHNYVTIFQIINVVNRFCNKYFSVFTWCWFGDINEARRFRSGANQIIRDTFRGDLWQILTFLTFLTWFLL